MSDRGGARAGLLAGLFVVGFALMGFEMLGSRYLNPYFGSGITTWASLISIVLTAMMVGYFAGGYAADARPGVGLLAICTIAAGTAILIVPPLADPVQVALLESFGDGFSGVLAASFCLSFVPVALLSACSPLVVRLLLVDLQSGGRTAGLVYAISTLGNVAGTLFTTFVLIPSYGVRSITYAFGIILVVLGVVVLIARRRLERGVLAALALAAIGSVALSAPPLAAEPLKLPQRIEAAYPEGPLWVGNRLYYTEMSRDRVRVWEQGTVRDFWTEPGCGPTAISKLRDSDFLILCHLGRRVVEVSNEGHTLAAHDAASDSTPLQDPNDCHTDGAGGVFFSDPGPFSLEASASGRVYHLAPDGRITLVTDGLRYANGVAYAPSTRLLYVSEHLARRVWVYELDGERRVVDRRVVLDVAKALENDPEALSYPLVGPDGIELDAAGNIVVPIYGAGLVLAVTPAGEVRRRRVATRFVTNVAISPTLVATVGAYVNDQSPFPGEVVISAHTPGRLAEYGAPIVGR